MSTEKTSSTNKRRGRPDVDSEQVRSRLHRPLLDRLDRWRSGQPDAPNRPEAIRRLLDAALPGDGE